LVDKSSVSLGWGCRPGVVLPIFVRYACIVLLLCDVSFGFLVVEEVVLLSSVLLLPPLTLPSGFGPSRGSLPVFMLASAFFVSGCHRVIFVDLRLESVQLSLTLLGFPGPLVDASLFRVGLILSCRGGNLVFP
jgi:hypothetical protein